MLAYDDEELAYYGEELAYDGEELAYENEELAYNNEQIAYDDEQLAYDDEEIAYRLTQQKCPIRILSSNLFQKSNFTFQHVFRNEHIKPVSSGHLNNTSLVS